jgi:hypothetical protein
MPSARLRAGPSAKVVVRMDRPAGTVNPAEAPLTKRRATMAPSLLNVALTNEAAPKTVTAMRNTVRRLTRSDVRPPRSRNPP